MKVAYLLAIMLVFATAVNALNTERFGKEMTVQETSEVPEYFMTFLQMVGGDNLMENSCARQSFAAVFGFLAVVNLIIHGDQWHHVITRLFLFFGDFHSALVECGVI
ncbi:unnamed protein product [Moneuplotes crassus]|uniref:Uncharacterized protein n=1 Tax=Euplotes crassus TaxID=5936 RepID=A0AAD1Y3H4_EUPCR|nr:unnamed protein product [Moneuplotes crassus]